MNKAWSTIEGLKEEIIKNALFDFRFIPEESRNLSEYISSIAFGHDRKEIYITCQNWSQEIVKNWTQENSVDLITEEVVSKGYQILFADKKGNITSTFEFENCHLKDKAEIKLDYNVGSKIPMFIISLSYENIYKITE